MNHCYLPIAISKQELKVLSDFAKTNYASHTFKDANMRGNRVTTRYTDERLIRYPQEAYNIRERIQQALVSSEPISKFPHGIVVSYAKIGDSCYSHKDPVWVEDKFTVHCNLLVSPAESGGDLYIEKEYCAMPVGTVICYPVSEVEHETTQIKGVSPRIVWIFGFTMKPEDFYLIKDKYNKKDYNG